jgi:mono/diheme cytochrome c family protein
MRRSLMTLILAAAMPVAAIAQDAGGQAAGGQAAGGPGAKPALYTADQANAGAAVYAQSCAACHGSQLEGVAAPALKGPAFGDMANAQSLTADALLDVIVNTMPQSDPGSLKPEEFAAVTAYILQQNNYPAGTVALTKDEPGLKDAKITP